MCLWLQNGVLWGRGDDSRDYRRPWWWPIHTLLSDNYYASCVCYHLLPMHLANSCLLCNLCSNDSWRVTPLAFTCACVHTHMHMCTYTHMHMHTHTTHTIHIHTHIHTHIHGDTHTHTHTLTHTDTHTQTFKAIATRCKTFTSLQQ